MINKQITHHSISTCLSEINKLVIPYLHQSTKLNKLLPLL